MFLNKTMNYSHLLRNIHDIKRIFSIRLCVNISNKEFTPIYKFPYIRAVAIINRLKLYQSVSTVASVPGSILLCNFGIISIDTVINTCILGITGTLSLFLFGSFAHKIIGFLYVKNDNKVIKISYLGFWGQRKDVEIPIDDLVPLSDLPAIPTDPIYLTMRRFTSPEIFKINLRYGIVLEKTKFNKVFLQDI